MRRKRASTARSGHVPRSEACIDLKSTMSEPPVQRANARQLSRKISEDSSMMSQYSSRREMPVPLKYHATS
jgi:hypothetical protein